MVLRINAASVSSLNAYVAGYSNPSQAARSVSGSTPELARKGELTAPERNAASNSATGRPVWAASDSRISVTVRPSTIVTVDWVDCVFGPCTSWATTSAAAIPVSSA